MGEAEPECQDSCSQPRGILTEPALVAPICGSDSAGECRAGPHVPQRRRPGGATPVGQRPALRWGESVGVGGAKVVGRGVILGCEVVKPHRG